MIIFFAMAGSACLEEYLCDENATCIDTDDGNSTCECLEGYTGDGLNCTERGKF